jgi:GGDEF domain-containing protein
VDWGAKHLIHSFDEPCFKLYRLHGDEFAIVATKHNTFEEFLNKLQLFANAFSNEEFNNDGTLLSFNVSIGLTPIKENPVKSMTCALIALKHAKNSKEMLVHYSDELPIIKAYEKNIYTLGFIKEAIKENSVVPYFQPIFSHKEGVITKYEP